MSDDIPILETRPICDLSTKLDEIEQAVKGNVAPIVITRDGAPVLVVMDPDVYNAHLTQERALRKLREAEIEAKYKNESYTFEQSQERVTVLAQMIEGLHA